MNKSSQPEITIRKKPQQARSNDLVAIILQAAYQVLLKEGIHDFTTARVAERAGVSVGSIYQYFPNKAAILFRLQAEEWEQTNTTLRGILENKQVVPLERLKVLIRTFIQSEFDEALIRKALENMVPLYHQAPEALQTHHFGQETFDSFIKELVPNATFIHQKIVGNVMMTALRAVGENLSNEPYDETQIRLHISVLYSMFVSYIDLLNLEHKLEEGDN